MAETVGTLFIKVRALLDEYTDEGVVTPQADVVDMQMKFIKFADMAHKDIYRLVNTSAVLVPPELTATTNTLSINDIDAQAIVYYGAARLAPFENKDLVTFFESKYDELKREAKNNVRAVEVDITDSYPVSESGGW